MKDAIAGTYLEMLLRDVDKSTDRELSLRCCRCDRMWVVFVTEAEMIEAYRSFRRIPMSPSPVTVMHRVQRAESLRAMAIGHVCAPRGLHPSIDDSATSAEWFEALSCYFAELAIDATRVSQLEPTRLAQIEMLMPEDRL